MPGVAHGDKEQRAREGALARGGRLEALPAADVAGPLARARRPLLAGGAHLAERKVAPPSLSSRAPWLVHFTLRKHARLAFDMKTRACMKTRASAFMGIFDEAKRTCQIDDFIGCQVDDRGIWQSYH